MLYLDAQIDRSKSTLIIAPAALHKAILLEINTWERLFDFDLMVRSEWLANHTYVLHKDAKAKVFEVLDLKPHMINTLFKVLPFYDADYHQESSVQAVFEFLMEQGLIEKEPWANQPLKEQVVFIGETRLNRYEEALLESVYQGCPVYHRQLPQSQEAIPVIPHITEYDEVVTLAEKIAHAIQVDQVPLNKIKVHVPSPSYETLIHCVFPRFNLTYACINPLALNELPIAQVILNQIEACEADSKTCFDGLIATLLAMPTHALKTRIVQAFHALLSDYISLNQPLKFYLPLIKQSLKDTTVQPTYSDAVIHVGNMVHQTLEAEDHVFVCGVNEGELPQKAANNTFLNDAFFEALGIETVYERTVQYLEQSEAFLYHPSVRHASYAFKSFTNEKIPSSIVDRLIKKGRLTTERKVESEVRYAPDQDLLEVGKMLHAYTIYGTLDNRALKTMASLKHLSKTMPKPFTHKKSTLAPHLVEALLKPIGTISYSRLEDYFKCQFRFLMKHGLKVPEKDGYRTARFIGSFFHEALSEIEQVPKEETARHAWYDDLVNKLATQEKTPLTEEEQFYLTLLYPTLDAFIQAVDDFHQTSQYDIFALEKKYTVDLPGTWLKSMVGIVDKIMHLNEDFAIIDYKSSARYLNLAYLEKGINSQLPFYMHIVQNHTPGLSTPTALLYHPFSTTVPRRQDNKTILEQRDTAWKMTGMINTESVPAFDPDYAEASRIKDIKLKNNGDFIKRAPIYTKEEHARLGAWMKQLVHQAIVKIESGHFKINPKGEKLSESPSCQYCEFFDICYRSSRDLEPFNYKSDRDFIHSIEGVVDDSE